MKNIAIISLFPGSVNYGGVLQAFALNTVLSNLGFNAVQIKYSQTKSVNIQHKKTLPEFLKEHDFSYILSKIIRTIFKVLRITPPTFNKKAQLAIKKRESVFSSFRKANVEQTAYYTQDNIRDLEEYDGYICGSDQIWHPAIANENYFLTFAPSNKTRFAYAPSIPVASLDEISKGLYTKWLNSLDGISVRENNSVDLLQPLCKQTVHWVLDPTLLLTGEQWRAYAEPEKINDKYLFCYFLGTDRKYRKAAMRYAKKHNLKIVTYPHLIQKPVKADNNFGDIQIADNNPLQFVYLIDNAECVFTDSFHASAFSANLHTPFYVFQRSSYKSMESRITSLLNLISLTDRFVHNYSDVAENGGKINWEVSDKNLDDMRKKSFAYLNEQLNKINETGIKNV